MEVQPERYWQGLAADSFSLRYTLPSENSIITPDEMDRLGNCQQTATYRWGFSFLLLFILLVFFVVWILGTYALWVDAYLHSRLDIAERDMGLYRAALDISSVLQSDLDKDIDAMTPNSVLRKRIKDHKNRGRISLQPLNDTLSMKTRMMRVRAWGRTGGYSRWIPRFSLVLLVVLLLVVLFVIFTFYGWSWRMTEPIMTWILFLFGFLVLINILVLGNGKQRALCRRCSQDRDAAHHSLRSLDDTLPPNEPMISMAEISTSEHRNHEGQPQNNSRASKSAVSTTTEHKEYYP